MSGCIICESSWNGRSLHRWDQINIPQNLHKSKFCSASSKQSYIWKFFNSGCQTALSLITRKFSVPLQKQVRTLICCSLLHLLALSNESRTYRRSTEEICHSPTALAWISTHRKIENVKSLNHKYQLLVEATFFGYTSK